MARECGYAYENFNEPLSDVRCACAGGRHARAFVIGSYFHERLAARMKRVPGENIIRAYCVYAALLFRVNVFDGNFQCVEVGAFYRYMKLFVVFLFFFFNG